MDTNITRDAVEDFQDELAAGVGGLPPGYIEGFRPVLLSNLTIEVGGGVTSVQGSAVYMQEQILTQQMWHSPYTGGSEGFYYYVYLTVKGEYKVDFTKPEFSGTYYYYAHPAFGWRVILRLWIDSDDVIKYVSREFRDTPRVVTVAPEGYVGEADYYCDGVNDEIWIGAAVDYAGEVRIFSGDFYLRGVVTLKSNVAVIGGGGTKLHATADAAAGADIGFYAYQTADTRFSNVVIENIQFVGVDADSLSIIYYDAIWTEYVDNLTIRNCVFDYGAYARSRHGLTCVVEANEFRGKGLTFVDNEFSKIINNHFKNCGAFVDGVDSRVIVSGNSFLADDGTTWNARLALAGGASYAGNISVSNNTFERATIFGLDANATFTGNTFFNSPAMAFTGSTVVPHISLVGNQVTTPMVRRDLCQSTTEPTLYDAAASPGAGVWERSTAQKLVTTNLATTYSWKHFDSAADVYLDGNSTSSLLGLSVNETYEVHIWYYVPTGATVGNIYFKFQGYDGSSWNDIATGQPSGYDAFEEVTITGITTKNAYVGFRYLLDGAEEYYVGLVYLLQGGASNHDNRIIYTTNDGEAVIFDNYKDNSWQEVPAAVVSASKTLEAANAGYVSVDPTDAAVTITMPSPAIVEGLRFHIANRHYGYGLMGNGSLEADSVPAMNSETPADSGNVTWSRSDVVARGGTYSGKMLTTDGATTDQFFHDAGADLHGLTASQTYTLVVWTYVPTTGGPSAITEVYAKVQDVTNTVTLATSVPTKYDTWERHALTFTIPATCSHIDLYMEMHADTSADEYFYIDDIQLYRHYDVTVSGPIENVPSFVLPNEGDFIILESDGDKYLAVDYTDEWLFTDGAELEYTSSFANASTGLVTFTELPTCTRAILFDLLIPDTGITPQWQVRRSSTSGTYYDIISTHADAGTNRIGGTYWLVTNNNSVYKSAIQADSAGYSVRISGYRVKL